MTSEDRARVAAWSRQAETEGEPLPVHHTIAALARTQPEAVAVVFDDERLTYADLDARANRLAHRLIALGVRPEARVGIAVERSVAMVVGLLGILKAGAAWVPLDPQLPAERLRYMAEDSAIALLLTHGAPPIETDRVLDLADDLSNEPTHDPQVPVHPEQLAYVIYTSGSTGRPKGAANRHGSLARCMAWMQATYGLGAADAVLHKAPFGFDVSVWELFWPLTAGSRLVLARPGDQRDPERIVQLIREHGITTLNFVPAMLQAFLAHEGIEAQTRLRYVICGGEAMPAATQREALRRLKGVSLQNLYGPTETTIHVTQWTCRDDGRTQVPIGRPISGTRTLVLDAQLNEVPAGVAGELYLGGVNLGRGYLGKPGLTSERFVADEGGERLYRTGDLVRWNSEGQLEYLGRIDHQVKVRGFRIELGEVEAQLLACADVREAVAVARGGTLAAYVSPQAGARLEATVLRDALARVLPDHMVPAAVMVLDRLPLNANGKVDRQALPAPAPAAARADDAPRGEAEAALAAIWQEVLGVERVGRHDNFFELGGHSILAVRVVALARERRVPGPPVTLRALMGQPTIQGLLRPAPSLTLLNRQTAAAPLFCIHSGLGTVLGYLPLARALNSQRPVYGLACRTLNDPRHRDTSLGAMARDYAAMLREVQPEGPYHLLGWSLGGALAVLVAAELEAAGQAVAFVGLIDSTVPSERTDAAAGSDWRADYLRFLRHVTGDAQTAQPLPPAGTPDPLESEAPLREWTASWAEGRLVGRYEGVSADELVRLFLIERCLTAATRRSRLPLPALRAPVRCWWARERRASALGALSQQLGSDRVSHTWVDADHDGIVSHPAVLDAMRTWEAQTAASAAGEKRPVPAVAAA